MVLLDIFMYNFNFYVFSIINLNKICPVDKVGLPVIKIKDSFILIPPSVKIYFYSIFVNS
jgi:hypothetical protein